jgi:hypothetical protein
MSIPNIKALKISNFTAKDFQPPDFANTVIFAFSVLNLSKIIKELL